MNPGPPRTDRRWPSPLALVVIPVLLAACGSSWDGQSAVAPVRDRLDVSGDGVVDRAEYNPVAPLGPSFRRVDRDGDGDLSLSEIQWLLLEQDPETFDGADERQSIAVSMNPDVYHPDPLEVRLLRELFAFMTQELEQRGGELDLPSREERERAAATGNLRSPEARAVAARLRAACRAAELPVPEVLREP